MGMMASQITSLAVVYSTIYSGADQRTHQCSASLAFVLPVNSLHKGPVMQKMFPFDDVIMQLDNYSVHRCPTMMFGLQHTQCWLVREVLFRLPKFWGNLLWLTWFKFNPIMDRYIIFYKVYTEIIYPFPSFNDAFIEVWDWVGNFIPLFTGQMINSCLTLSNSVLKKDAPFDQMRFFIIINDNHNNFLSSLSFS